MEHSEMYTYFIDLINGPSVDRRRSGIPSLLLDEIYDWEREEIEDIIWRRFQVGDVDMTYYLPRLKYYQPVEKIEEMVSGCKIPSRMCVQLMYALYKINSDPDCLEIIKTNIVMKKEHTSYAALVVQDLDKEDKKIYDFLCNLYVSDIDTLEASIVEDGIMYLKGFRKKLFSFELTDEERAMHRKYYSEDVEERKRLMAEFRKEFG